MYELKKNLLKWELKLQKKKKCKTSIYVMFCCNTSDILISTKWTQNLRNNDYVYNICVHIYNIIICK